MKEKIYIENFLSIKTLDLKLDKINILIGHQTAGKSICSKLLFFFKSLIAAEIKLDDVYTENKFNKKINSKFFDYFPKKTLGTNDFYIKYELNNIIFEIIKNNGKIYFKYSSSIVELLSKKKEIFQICKNDFSKNYNKADKHLFEYLSQFGTTAGYNQFFIPAGRSFFANIQTNIFTFLQNRLVIDPFITHLGVFYNNIKNDYEKFRVPQVINTIQAKLLSGKFVKKNGDEYILSEDGRRLTDILHTSSGQQELLPLIMTLGIIPFLESPVKGKTIYIEEPEAHLFPTFQKLMVEFIALIYNMSDQPIQLFITTHSPYILTTFNNLIQAGEIEKSSSQDKKEKLYKIINKNKILNFDDIAAYSLSNGKCKTILSSETNLITTNIIDDVSNELAMNFDSLLDLED